MKMPLTVKPMCSQCESTESAMWRKIDGSAMCCSCFEMKKEGEKMETEQKIKEEEQQMKSEHIDQPKPLKAPLRKSTRTTRNYKTRGNPYAAPKPVVGRGRGRRGLQKRAPMRNPSEGRSWIKTNRAYLLDGYLRIGDVVSLCGTDDVIYYAQLRGFVCDFYGEKMGVITWLLPKTEREKGKFVPEDFYLGPDEDTPRRLDTMELVFRGAPGHSKFCTLTRDLTDDYMRDSIQVS